MKISFSNVLISLALMMILVGYNLPFTHVEYLGFDGSYVSQVYSEWYTYRRISYLDLFILFPIIALILTILIISTNSLNNQWLFPIGTCLSIFSSSFAYLYVRESGYQLINFGMGWLVFYVAGNLIAIIGLINLIRNSEYLNASTAKSMKLFFKGIFKTSVKIILWLVAVVLIILVLRFFSTTHEKDQVRDAPAPMINEEANKSIPTLDPKTSNFYEQEIPMTDKEYQGRYFLIRSEKVKGISTVVYKAIYPEETIFSKMEINCSNNKIRAIGEGINSLDDLSDYVDKGKWSTPTFESTRDDVVKFICS